MSEPVLSGAINFGWSWIEVVRAAEPSRGTVTYRSREMPTPIGDSAAFHTFVIASFACALRDQLGVVECEAVVQQRGARALASLVLLAAQNHGDEPHAVAQRRGHEAIAGCLGVTGLQSVDGLVRIEEAVAVLLLDVVVVELANCENHCSIAGKSRMMRGREQRQVAGRRVVVRVGESGGVRRSACPTIPSCFAVAFIICANVSSVPAIALGERDGRIVAGLHDHAEDQRFRPAPACRLE